MDGGTSKDAGDAPHGYDGMNKYNYLRQLWHMECEGYFKAMENGTVWVKGKGFEAANKLMEEIKARGEYDPLKG